jgi:hypothetical protein
MTAAVCCATIAGPTRPAIVKAEQIEIGYLTRRQSHDFKKLWNMFSIHLSQKMS